MKNLRHLPEWANFSSSEIIFDATEEAGIRALVSVGWVCKMPHCMGCVTTLILVGILLGRAWRRLYSGTYIHAWKYTTRLAL